MACLLVRVLAGVPGLYTRGGCSRACLLGCQRCTVKGDAPGRVCWVDKVLAPRLCRV